MTAMREIIVLLRKSVDCSRCKLVRAGVSLQEDPIIYVETWNRVAIDPQHTHEHSVYSL